MQEGPRLTQRFSIERSALRHLMHSMRMAAPQSPCSCVHARSHTSTASFAQHVRMLHTHDACQNNDASAKFMHAQPVALQPGCVLSTAAFHSRVHRIQGFGPLDSKVVVFFRLPGGCSAGPASLQPQLPAVATAIAIVPQHNAPQQQRTSTVHTAPQAHSRNLDTHPARLGICVTDAAAKRAASRES